VAQSKTSDQNCFCALEQDSLLRFWNRTTIRVSYCWRCQYCKHCPNVNNYLHLLVTFCDSQQPGQLVWLYNGLQKIAEGELEDCEDMARYTERRFGDDECGLEWCERGCQWPCQMVSTRRPVFRLEWEEVSQSKYIAWSQTSRSILLVCDVAVVCMVCDSELR